MKSQETINALNEGNYGNNAFDVMVDFATGKASPTARVVIDAMRGVDFDGNTPTWKSTLYNLTVPLSIDNYQDLEKNPNSANILAGMIAEGLGIGVNTFK